MNLSTRTSRRKALVALGACALPTLASSQNPAADHEPFGPVRPPLLLPNTRLVTNAGTKTTLAALLQGHVTALQLMFTGCSAVCPIQGAVFAAAQQRLGNKVQGAQWVSISIDPLSDDPRALDGWLQRLQAREGWIAAAPDIKEVDALTAALRGVPNAIDRHTGAAFIFDRRAQLVFRTADLPSPEHLVDLLSQVAARG